jgi:hypothetical protein
VSPLPLHLTPIPEIEAEIDSLKDAPVAVLREHWKRFFDGQPPRAFGPDLLRRSIAQRLQERAYGGLPKEIVRTLDKLMASHAKSESSEPVTPPRRIRAGAILHREWKGVSHSVTVHNDQFLYQGKAYSNLSQIARLITGTRWNGPRFFGLREQESSTPNRTASPPRTSKRLAADAGVPA